MEKCTAEEQGVGNLSSQSYEGLLNGSSMVGCAAGCGLSNQGTAISITFSYGRNDGITFTKIFVYSFLLCLTCRDFFFVQDT